MTLSRANPKRKQASSERARQRGRHDGCGMGGACSPECPACRAEHAEVQAAIARDQFRRRRVKIGGRAS